MAWGFYGRQPEVEDLTRILSGNRWFFVKVTGRRRIGKTTLIQRALQGSGRQKVFYFQTPDSAAAGVLSAVHDAFETFGLTEQEAPRPHTLRDLAKTIGTLVRAGFTVAIDEFQYFHRKVLAEFCSHLQAEVDRLVAPGERVIGGLIVLGSIHTEVTSLLEDRDAPLYNRATNALHLSHLDLGAIRTMLSAHDAMDPHRLLFLWNLFEGVPKFYRDCFEIGVLGAPRRELLDSALFTSSAPLRNEAENWFLRELRGRYDVVLKFLARHPGCHHADILAYVQTTSPETKEQVGGYLKILEERYGMIERLPPVFAEKRARRNRYYIADNFLRTWLAALASPINALAFRSKTELLAEADQRLAIAEGHGLERLIGKLYEERSRKALPGFALTHRISGYWDRGDTELDLVALDETRRIVRLANIKRSPEKLLTSEKVFLGHVERFLDAFPHLREWQVERAAITVALSREERAELVRRGFHAEDLMDLLPDA
ncbi:MAG: ATP-binding protein [Planctomycetota bacterium]|nr:ATP-binding protein [Planctomycetota bacterium]